MFKLNMCQRNLQNFSTKSPPQMVSMVSSQCQIHISITSSANSWIHSPLIPLHSIVTPSEIPLILHQESDHHSPALLLPSHVATISYVIYLISTLLPSLFLLHSLGRSIKYKSIVTLSIQNPSVIIS